MKKPSETLRELANLQELKDAEYGADWQKFGERMAVMFPRGIHLHEPADFGRFALMVWMMSKLSRYANNFTAGGHPDSLKDLAVYATMLEAVDDDNR